MNDEPIETQEPTEPHATGRLATESNGAESNVTGQPTFRPPCGPVAGWADGDVHRATGIPYAAADRFELPVPLPDRRNTEPLQATQWSPPCPQAPVPFLDEVLGGWAVAESTRTDEHCQRLSITMPADRGAGEQLPVLVWIHGGAYVSGAGDLRNCDPRALVAEQRVIVVTVTYRLGLFGYLGGAYGRPANLGLFDQLEAVRWVHRNIAAFGGDPARVTLVGQSAGGDAVAHLMAVPGATGLFARAIIQSAPLGISRGRAAMTQAMQSAAGPLDPRAPVDELVTRQEAVSRAAARHGLRSAMPFGPQYGHPPLPAERGIDAAWDEVAPRVPVLIGYTSEEARLFVPRIEALQSALSRPRLGPALRRGLVGAATEAVYGRAARRFARRHAAAGGQAWRYVIDFGAANADNADNAGHAGHADNEWGAAHTIDLPLLFGGEPAWRTAALLTGVDWAEVDRAGRGLRAMWAAFARGEDLGDRGGVEAALRYRRVGRSGRRVGRSGGRGGRSGGRRTGRPLDRSVGRRIEHSTGRPGGPGGPGVPGGARVG